MKKQILFLPSFLLFLHFLTSSGYKMESENLVIPETPIGNCNVTLDFSNMNFGPTIRAKFISSLYVSNIKLRGNNILNFQEGAFDSVPNLEHLDLSSNKLKLNNLFSFGGHSSLKTLILDDNFNEVPGVFRISTLNRYRRQYNYTNSRGDLPGDDDYMETTESDQGSSTIEPIVSKDRKLKQISYTFPQLKTLSLRNVYMKSSSIQWDSAFPKLTNLDLSGNKLQNSILNMIYDFPISISTIILKNAGLTSFTMSQSRLMNIKELYLDENQFFTITSNYTYYLLNKDNVLHINLLHLEKLSLRNCEIQTLKVDAFANMDHLLELDIAYNSFLELESGTLNHLSSLIYLDLSGNQIKKMPDISILKNLNTLLLNNMSYKTIFKSFEVPNIIKNLKILSLEKNGLQSISQKFLNNFPLLEELNLNDNLISILPIWNSQNKLITLKLNGNLIVNFDNLSLVNATSLKIIELVKNPLSNICKKSLKSLSDDTNIIINS